MANAGVILGFPFIIKELYEPRWKRKAGKSKSIAAHLNANNCICFLSTESTGRNHTWAVLSAK